jgi:hypothetical protein
VLKQDKADALIAQAERSPTGPPGQRRRWCRWPAATRRCARAVRAAAVRDQIRDQVKAEVMATAKQENWAAPNTFPDWASRISFDGDMRLRDESRYYSGSNSNEIVDFAKLNDNGPYDVNPTAAPTCRRCSTPAKTATTCSACARALGMKAVISPEWTAGIRIGTGSDNNPVSTTQNLGGGFGKKDIWLDQGYLNWKTTDELTLTGGRIANPFMSTDMLYSNDLNFDGVAAIFDHKLNNDWGLFGTVGAFPVEYTSTPPQQWLRQGRQRKQVAVRRQVGADWAQRSNRLKGALAYYRSTTSKASVPALARPGRAAGLRHRRHARAFMQKGNTCSCRDITTEPGQPDHTPQPQFVGLASKFDVLT